MNNHQNLPGASQQFDCKCAVEEAQHGLHEGAVLILHPAAPLRCDPSATSKAAAVGATFECAAGAVGEREQGHQLGL